MSNAIYAGNNRDAQEPRSCSAVRTPQIQSDIERLQRETETLREGINALRERLEPHVLHPSGPQAAIKSDPESQIPVGLCAKLSVVMESVMSSNCAIREIMDRLEI